MKLFSFFTKMFGSKPKVSVFVEEEILPLIEEQPVVIVSEEEPKKKRVHKVKPKKVSL